MDSLSHYKGEQYNPNCHTSERRCICWEYTRDVLKTISLPSRGTMPLYFKTSEAFSSIKIQAQLPLCEVPNPAGLWQAETQRFGNKPLMPEIK